MGYKVPRRWLRHTLHNIDVLASTLRWDGNLRPRRPYSVPGPNSLWHIGTYEYAYVCIYSCIAVIANIVWSQACEITKI